MYDSGFGASTHYMLNNDTCNRDLDRPLKLLPKLFILRSMQNLPTNYSYKKLKHRLHNIEHQFFRNNKPCNLTIYA